MNDWIPVEKIPQHIRRQKAKAFFGKLGAIGRNIAERSKRAGERMEHAGKAPFSIDMGNMDLGGNPYDTKKRKVEKYY